MLSKALLPLAAREALSLPKLDRQPEQTGAIELTEDEFAQTEEASGRALQGIYHFCALATSWLVPQNGLILDLGSGTGAFAVYLAQHRPDISILGVESNARMVEHAANKIAEDNLVERINVNEGDIADFSKRIPTRVDMITSVLSLHDLATSEDLSRCLKEISLVRIRCGCAVWLFDYARPNLAKTADDFPETLIPVAPLPFRRMCRNALLAAFTYREMSEFLAKMSLGTVHHAQSKALKIYQAHWLGREDGLTSKDELWHDGRMSENSLRNFKSVSSMFPSVSLPKHLK